MTCYVCGQKGGSHNKLVLCVGTAYCTAIHHGLVSHTTPTGEQTVSLGSILTDAGQRERSELRKCNFETGRNFHPKCLRRDPAGASCNALYSTDKNRERFLPRDQTHKLCDDCLKQWVDDGGTIDNKLTKEDPILTEAERNRRRAKAASGSRRREAQLIGRHSSQGDKKLILTATHAGGALKPIMCANMHAIWEMGKQNPDDPRLKRIVTNVNQIINLWEEIAKMIKDVKMTGTSSTTGRIADHSASTPGQVGAIAGTASGVMAETAVVMVEPAGVMAEPSGVMADPAGVMAEPAGGALAETAGMDTAGGFNTAGGNETRQEGLTASAVIGHKRELAETVGGMKTFPTSRAKTIKVCGPTATTATK